MFQSLNSLPADPILGLMAAYRADPNPLKVDLGIGVYKDEKGSTTVMTAVKKAEDYLLKNQITKTYIGPTGAADYNSAVAELLLGQPLNDSLGKRRVTIQAPGGCGGLRLAAEFIKSANPEATVWVSDPTWANHIPLLGSAGLKIKSYPYYDRTTHSVSFEEMLEALKKIGKGDLVLLHGCCHNPTGANLTADQLQQAISVIKDVGAMPFMDIAYQGFGDGLAADGSATRAIAASFDNVLIAASCSKNFGIYRERTGLPLRHLP